jgi:hypothetical protein
MPSQSVFYNRASPCASQMPINSKITNVTPQEDEFERSRSSLKIASANGSSKIAQEMDNVGQLLIDSGDVYTKSEGV